MALVIDSMAFVVRGDLVDSEWLVRSRELKVCKVTWRVDGLALVLMAVDLSSDPTNGRDHRLRKLTVLMREHRPDVVVGDFNAPRRSR